ncbi:MAG: endonuclease [Bacilli bacterium]|nr:endonuclease [Bacilli bacterium]
MKRKTILNGIATLSSATFMVVAGVTAFNGKKDEIAKTEATIPSTDVPTENILLDDCTDEEIIAYYDGLNGLTPSQLSGENLLIQLKSIIRNNVSYYSYGSGVKSAYVVTERDWKNSGPETFSDYDPVTNTIKTINYTEEQNKNPYYHLLYHDYTLVDKTRRSGDGDVSSSSVSYDQEHIWSQSHGFDNSIKANLTGAGSDMHHLQAGAQYGNRYLHSNYSYGFVKNLDWKDSDVPQVEKKNKRGSPLFPRSGDQENKVFEPQDSDKGDIARSLLYMVAAYNNLDGSTPTPEDPALKLVNYIISENNTGYSSDEITNGYYGALEDILAWHYMDPVDEYEIHRNNLIYRNYQHNRNPFIDYPEWVDYIWGRAVYNPTTKQITHESPSGYVDLDYDAINDYRENMKTITKMEITKQPSKTVYYDDETFDATGMEVTVTYDDLTTKDVTDLVSIEVDLTTVGTQTVTVKYKKEVATTTVTVLERTDPVSSVELDKDSLTFRVGDVAFLNPTVLPRSAANKNIVWSSSDNSVVTVENGKLTGTGEGTAVITATSESDSTIYDTCNITISGIRYDLSETTYELVQSNDQIDLERKFIIASSANELVMNNQDSTNRRTYEAFKNEEDKTLDVSDEFAAFTLESGTVEGTYAFKDNESNQYLYANGNGNNYLKSQSEIDEYASFTIDISTDADTGITTTNIYGNGDNPNKYMGFNTPNIISCYSSQKTGANGINLYQQVERTGGDEIHVTGIRLNKTSLILNKGETETLSARVLPGDANNRNFEWTSSAPDVATIDDTGLITAVSVGNTVITATTEEGEFVDACELRVNSESTGTAYYEKISSLNEFEDGNYVIAAYVNENYYALPNAFPTTYGKISSPNAINVTDNKISTSNATNYVVTIETNGSTITISNGTSLLGANASYNLKADGDNTDWTLDVINNKGTFSITCSTGYLLKYQANNQEYGAYKASTAAYYNLELFKYTEGEGDYVVDNFVADFLGAFTCDQTGLTEPVFKEGWSWTILKGKYESLTSEEQLELKNYVANEFGNDEAKCVARYDYIVKKYGTTKYPNWMNRTISPNANVMIFKTGTNIVFINIIIGSLLALSIGSFIFFRKKRKEY